MERDHPSRQRALRTTEVNAINGRREEFKRREIQLVKCIEEVCLNFEKRSLAQKPRQTGSLTKTEVDCEKSWTTERVATNARQQRSIGIVGIEERQPTAGKVSPRSNECVVVGIFERAAKISR